MAFVGIGWLVGHLVRVQQQLLTKQRQSRAQLAAHVVADERRRIAREVHDVIAHSLSITLLHLTAARHALEHDSDNEHAVHALQQAELLGRQAMTDIRHTVGLLDDDPSTRTELRRLRHRAACRKISGPGFNLAVHISGDLQRLSASTGLTLYRVAQESLANIAKHAPSSPRVHDGHGAAVLGVLESAHPRPDLFYRRARPGRARDETACRTAWRNHRGRPVRRRCSVRACVPVEQVDAQWPTWTGSNT